MIRRASTPSPEPQRRVDRAQLFLESGRVDPAIGEVKNLPNAQEAADWIADAQRYAAARDALDLLEKTAILELERAARPGRTADQAAEPGRSSGSDC